MLPTGAGKTFVAELAMTETARSTLVIAPTLDLVGQWHDLLKKFNDTLASFGLAVHRHGLRWGAEAFQSVF